MLVQASRLLHASGIPAVDKGQSWSVLEVIRRTGGDALVLEACGMTAGLGVSAQNQPIVKNNSQRERKWLIKKNT